jgi:hypothetical protein
MKAIFAWTVGLFGLVVLGSVCDAYTWVSPVYHTPYPCAPNTCTGRVYFVDGCGNVIGPYFDLRPWFPPTGGGPTPGGQMLPGPVGYAIQSGHVPPELLMSKKGMDLGDAPLLKDRGKKKGPPPPPPPGFGGPSQGVPFQYPMLGGAEMQQFGNVQQPYAMPAPYPMQHSGSPGMMPYPMPAPMPTPVPIYPQPQPGGQIGALWPYTSQAAEVYQVQNAVTNPMMPAPPPMPSMPAQPQTPRTPGAYPWGAPGTPGYNQWMFNLALGDSSPYKGMPGMRPFDPRMPAQPMMPNMNRYNPRIPTWPMMPGAYPMSQQYRSSAGAPLQPYRPMYAMVPMNPMMPVGPMNPLVPMNPMARMYPMARMGPMPMPTPPRIPQMSPLQLPNMDDMKPPASQQSAGGTAYPTHPFTRSPRDFFMWSETMEDEAKMRNRPFPVPR